MPKINFYIKNAKSGKSTPIFLIINFNNQRVKIATGSRVVPKFWNFKTQRVRELIDYPEHVRINKRLRELSSKAEDIFDKYKADGVTPDKQTVKSDILNYDKITKKPNRSKSFWNYFDEFVEYKKTELSDVKDYDNSLRKHLKNVEKLYGSPITFALLEGKSSEFTQRFDKYLTYEAVNSRGDVGLSVNTIGKQYKNLKVFLNWYFEKEPSKRFSTKHLVTRTEETDAVYLTEEELVRISKIKLQDKNETIIRDLFIIGCETGFRFSDFTRLKKEHIINGKIYFRPKKTEDSLNKVIIPVSSRLKAVLLNNGGAPPDYQSESITDFNKTIRTLCEKAEIKDEVLISRKIAGKTIEELFKKYELVSSHTCRRTFCTLKFLDGMPVPAIMKFSGHKTERAFMRYLKLDSELVASRYAEYFR